MNVTISFTGGVTPELAAQFQTVCAEVAQAKVGQLTVLMASRGGDVTSGLAMFNTLRMMPCRVRTVNMGQCGSIAATIYLAGSARQAMPTANFFLHAASYVEGAEAGKVSPNTALILAPFRDLLGWDQARLDKHFSSPVETYLTVGEAAELGMVTDLTQPAWPQGELAAVLNPHGAEAPRLDAFIARLHKKARS
ncbi:MAG: ATP-dependent Clp protease proteolytic subunit [Sphingomonadales bacterium]|nr:ATP-dependent Clp protease proteolytic subunit [Sphingomonadales bacterium]